MWDILLIYKQPCHVKVVKIICIERNERLMTVTLQPTLEAFSKNASASMYSYFEIAGLLKKMKMKNTMTRKS